MSRNTGDSEKGKSGEKSPEGKNWNEITRGAHPVTLYNRRTTIIFGISG